MKNQNHINEAAQALISSLNRLRGRTLDEAWKISFDRSIAEETRIRHIGFKIAGISCAVPADAFCELVVKPDVSPLPNASGVLLGLCNIRGLLVPIYSLQFSVNNSPAPVSNVLLIGKGRHCIGLLVDDLPVTLELNLQGNQINHDAIPPAISPLFMDSCEQQGVSWHRVDVDKLGNSLVNLCYQEGS